MAGRGFAEARPRHRRRRERVGKRGNLRPAVKAQDNQRRAGAYNGAKVGVVAFSEGDASADSGSEGRRTSAPVRAPRTQTQPRRKQKGHMLLTVR